MSDYRIKCFSCKSRDFRVKISNIDNVMKLKCSKCGKYFANYYVISKKRVTDVNFIKQLPK